MLYYVFFASKGLILSFFGGIVYNMGTTDTKLMRYLQSSSASPGTGMKIVEQQPACHKRGTLVVHAQRSTGGGQDFLVDANVQSNRPVHIRTYFSLPSPPERCCSVHWHLPCRD